MLKLGLIQMRCSIDPLENVDKAEVMIRSAASDGANIICLQEIFNTIYFCQTEDHGYFRFAEEIPGPTTERLGKIAGELGVVVIAPIFERRAAGLYHNSAAILDADGSYLGKYRKMHIPDDPLFYEKFYFTPGDLGFRSWKTRYATIGVLICWDQWYPEGARLTALHGRRNPLLSDCDRLASKRKTSLRQAAAFRLGNDSTIPCDRKWLLCRGHRTEQGTKRLAEETGLSSGDRVSSRTRPERLSARRAVDREEALVVEIDLAQLELQRTHWPFLRDRRIDAYADISKRYID